MTSGSDINPNFIYDEIDRLLWRDELDGFLPGRIFDFHGHVNLARHCPPRSVDGITPSMPQVVDEYPHEALAQVERTIWPGRETKSLIFGSIEAGVDLEAMNDYVAEAARIHGWEALLIPPMDDDADALLAKVCAGGFIGFKPYWTFVHWKAQNDVTLEDMVTPAMREAMDRAGLMMTLHIPRAGRLVDPLNIAGIRKLCADAPNAKIVLAHFGRSYFPDAIGDGLSLADIDNLYIGLSMIQDWEVLTAIFRTFDRRKIVFGLDLPFGQEKGKLISVNGQRHFFTKRPHCWSIHAEPGAYEVRCTLFAYEMVRAIKRASAEAGLAAGEVEDVFCNNAQRLVESVRNKEKTNG